MNVVIRQAQPIDAPFIYQSWSKNQWHSTAKHQLPETIKPEWFKAKFVEIKEQIDSGALRVACPAEEPNLIMAYAAYRDGVPVWVYVKKLYRNEGIEALFSKKEGANG